MSALACPGCGYVRGATTGYRKLTRRERQALLDAGYELSTNVHGDDITRRPGLGWRTARARLHDIICRPTAWERVSSV